VDDETNERESSSIPPKSMKQRFFKLTPPD